MNLINYLTKIKIFKKIVPSLVKRFLKILGKHIFIQKYKGLNFKLNLHEPMDQMIFFHGSYEDEQISFLTKKIQQLNPHMFVDIGANSGIYSLLIGKKFPKLKVIAFEPVKETFLKFQKNIFLNKKIKNIIAHNYGLSNKEQNLKMKAKLRNGYIQQGGFGIAAKNENTSSLHTEFAFFKKGDNQFNVKNKIIFFKIDVEGHELNVLKGLLKTVSRNKIFMQIEIFDQQFKKTNIFLIKNSFKQIGKIYSDGKTDYYYQKI